MCLQRKKQLDSYLTEHLIFYFIAITSFYFYCIKYERKLNTLLHFHGNVGERGKTAFLNSTPGIEKVKQKVAEKAIEIRKQ